MYIQGGQNPSSVFSLISESLSFSTLKFPIAFDLDFVYSKSAHTAQFQQFFEPVLKCVNIAKPLILSSGCP